MRKVTAWTFTTVLALSGCGAGSARHLGAAGPTTSSVEVPAVTTPTTDAPADTTTTVAANPPPPTTTTAARPPATAPPSPRPVSVSSPTTAATRTTTASGGGPSTTAAPVAPTTTTAPAVTPPGSASITIQNFSFQPSTVRIAVGGTVTVHNADATAHTWTSDTGVWDSGNLASGASDSVTFSRAGTYQFHCNYHSFMTGTVSVG